MIVKENDLTGKTLSNYKVVTRLGRGGMATVYKAHELSLNRMVALKVLSTQLSEDKEYIKRFQREAQAAAQLNHPNIVQIYSIGEEKGIYYFAMEYIKGKSLAEIRLEKGVMMPDQAVVIIKQVADALHDAHQAGLVHRDIKPSNIMMDSLGRAKVTDFGIAYVSSAQTKLTREGSIIGTPEYLSPEQCEGKTVDQRSDIYSLGVTLYELLTGKTPYVADTPVSMLMKIVRGEFPPICEVNTNVPKALCKIVEKMMETSVDKRYKTMKEVLNDLQALDLGKVETVSPPAVNTSSIPKAATQQEPVPEMVEAEPAAVAPAAGTKSNKWAAFIVAAVIVLLMGGAFAAKMLIFDKHKTSSTDNAPDIVSTNADTTEAVDETSDSDGTGEPEGQTLAADASNTSEMGNDQTPGSEGAIDTTAQPLEQETQSQASQGVSQDTLQEGNSDTTRSSTSSGNLGSGGQAVSHTVRTPRPAPLPPANSCLVTAMGDSDKADIVGAYMEEILNRKNFIVVDGPSVAGKKIHEAARKHIVVTSKQLGTTTLNYYGNTSEQYTVAITAKVVSAKTGAIEAGPVTQTVKYTAINAEENIKEAVAKLITSLRL